jgi:cyclophilin family peptidyl-prolyl cis-trans isomerase
MSGRLYGIALLLLAFMVSTMASLHGQDKKKPQDDLPPGAPTVEKNAGAARASYLSMLAEWKDRLKKLRDLRLKYQTTTDKEKLIEIQEQWRKDVTEIEFTLPELTRAAVAAYKEAPNGDPELTGFLGKMLEDAYTRDEAEKAFELGELLIANEADQKNLYDMTGFAAFSINKFDEAKTYLEKAAKSGRISPYSREALTQIEDVRKKWEEEVKIRAKRADDAVAKEELLPLVQLQTSKGEIVLELFEDEAPETVGNFISLVESGFYKDRKFHRVLPHFMAQTGCPVGDGSGGPGYTIYCESEKPGARHHFRGTLSMAKTQAKDTGGSQFFMCFKPTPHLDGAHTVFGRVVKGLDVLSSIERTASENPEETDYKPGELTTLFDAKVLRKRDHEYKPNKVQ